MVPVDEDGTEILDSTYVSLQARVWAGRTRRSAYVEDTEDEEEGPSPQDQPNTDSDDLSDDSSTSGESEHGQAWYEHEAYLTRATLIEDWLRRSQAWHGTYWLYLLLNCLTHIQVK